MGESGSEKTDEIEKPNRKLSEGSVQNQTKLKETELNLSGSRFSILKSN